MSPHCRTPVGLLGDVASLSLRSLCQSPSKWEAKTSCPADYTPTWSSWMARVCGLAASSCVTLLDKRHNLCSFPLLWNGLDSMLGLLWGWSGSETQTAFGSQSVLLRRIVNSFPLVSSKMWMSPSGRLLFSFLGELTGPEGVARCNHSPSKVVHPGTLLYCRECQHCTVPIFKLWGSPPSKKAGKERREFWEWGERPRRVRRAPNVGGCETTENNSQWGNYLLVCPCHSLVYWNSFPFLLSLSLLLPSVCSLNSSWGVLWERSGRMGWS